MQRRNEFQFVSIFDENLTENTSLTEMDFQKILDIVKQTMKKD